MKLLENFYEEIKASEELKSAFAKAIKENTIDAFLKANDCDGTTDDLIKLVKSKNELEISDDDLEKVVGGTASDQGSYNCSVMVADPLSAEDPL